MELINPVSYLSLYQLTHNTLMYTYNIHIRVEPNNYQTLMLELEFYFGLLHLFISLFSLTNIEHISLILYHYSSWYQIRN